MAALKEGPQVLATLKSSTFKDAAFLKELGIDTASPNGATHEGKEVLIITGEPNLPLAEFKKRLAPYIETNLNDASGSLG
ncbi:MAG: hypothetical protein ACD_28C00202G0001 [uncultured bacterium]|nr:MAG: hypothetical protein ACD_28C00202G0001 [uncultured bacterium]KKT76844.1 MAG: hypothetical protein UW70_C0011G0015 [Candidatus Peregrinibacteria bacterium GW2011_GWA2_44_7]